MRIKRILLLLITVFSGGIYAAEAFSGDTLNSDKLYRDSTYRRVIKEGSSSLNCYFSYPQGDWQIRRDYGDNAYELEKLDKFMRSSFADTLIYVRRITLTGYCSIEGSYADNEILACNRANDFKNYLNSEYGLSRRYPVTVDYIGEDWDKLRSLVDTSTLPGREDILTIIDNTDIFKGREKKLMDLQNGIPYNRMMTELFPLLRRVEIVVEYDLHRIIEERFQCKLTETEFQEILVRERAATVATEFQLAEPRCREEEKQFRNEEVESLEERDFREKQTAERTAGHRMKRETRKLHNRLMPLFAVKTNVYIWAGMTPDFDYTAFTPNLSVELFFGHRWSAVASAAYANWNYDGDKSHWGVSAYSFEPRFWVNANRMYHFFYVGAYGQLGDFDNRSTDNHRMTEGTANCTGTYWEGGLSAGCYFLFNAHWGVEIGLRGGYRVSDVNTYDVEIPYNYFNRHFKEKHFGVMGVDISISYRFGSQK